MISLLGRNRIFLFDVIIVPHVSFVLSLLGSGYVRNDARGQSYSVGDDGLNYPKLNLKNQKVNYYRLLQKIYVFLPQFSGTYPLNERLSTR